MTQTPHSSTLRVAMIRARWHAGIVDSAHAGLVAELDRLRPGGTHVDVLDVPGAFEIPLMARRVATTGNYAAIVGAAFVVNGGIYRHDFVARTVIDGLMRVQLDADVPVLSCVLTPHQFQETPDHIAFFTRHFAIKGAEIARAALALDDIPVPWSAVA